MQKELHVVQAYCTNPLVVHGKLACQRALPPGHVGPCIYCKAPTDRITGGASTPLSVDHFIRLGPLYRLLFRETSIAQHIVDYWPTSISRLSTPPSDDSARVFCAESGLVARYFFFNLPTIYFDLFTYLFICSQGGLCCPPSNLQTKNFSTTWRNSSFEGGRWRSAGDSHRGEGFLLYCSRRC